MTPTERIQEMALQLYPVIDDGSPEHDMFLAFRSLFKQHALAVLSDPECLEPVRRETWGKGADSAYGCLTTSGGFDVDKHAADLEDHLNSFKDKKEDNGK